MFVTFIKVYSIFLTIKFLEITNKVLGLNKEGLFLPFSFGAPAAGGSLFGNNNAAAKPLFGQTAGTSFGATNTFGTPGASSFGATGFGGAQMGGMGGMGGFGQPQAQAQGQQGQGKINFQDLLQVNNLEKVPFIRILFKNVADYSK